MVPGPRLFHGGRIGGGTNVVPTEAASVDVERQVTDSPHSGGAFFLTDHKAQQPDSSATRISCVEVNFLHEAASEAAKSAHRPKFLPDRSGVVLSGVYTYDELLATALDDRLSPYSRECGRCGERFGAAPGEEECGADDCPMRDGT